MRAILGQQVTVHAATTIAGRFATAFGEAIETLHGSVNTLFPTAARIAALEPREVAEQGIIATRARAIVELARELASGKLRLDPTSDVESTVAALDALPGVGPWTAQYIAMRALAWPDAFPHPDVAVIKAMKQSKPAAALAASETLERPWRAYAVLHLWKSTGDFRNDPIRPHPHSRRNALRHCATNGALTGIYFDKQQHFPRNMDEWQEDANAAPVARMRRARILGEYFDGKRTAFDLPLAPIGTDFQQRVWKQIARIPFGETITYFGAREARREPKGLGSAAARARRPDAIR